MRQMSPVEFKRRMKAEAEASSAPVHILEGETNLNGNVFPQNIKFKAFSDAHVAIRFITWYKGIENPSNLSEWFYYKKDKARTLWDASIAEGYKVSQ